MANIYFIYTLSDVVHNCLLLGHEQYFVTFNFGNTEVHTIPKMSKVR